MGRKTHCTDTERNLIRKLKLEGKSYREISKLLSCSVCMVQNAIKPIQNTENRGKKRITSPQIDRRIVRLSKKAPFMTAPAIKKELDINISSRTVQRRLVEKGLHGRISRVVPALSLKNIKDRLNFARQYVSWNGQEGSKNWRNILWSDESKVNMCGSDGKHYVRRPALMEFHTKYTKKSLKHGGGNIKVWGCFSWYGIGPLFWIKENMDAIRYVEILENVMHPYAVMNMPLVWLYQQDNDPKHTSKLAKAWFVTKDVSLFRWPSQSPDLNPIENLWHDVKLAISDKRFKNKNDLWMGIEMAWRNIPVQRCRQLVESMSRRCAAVISSHGHSTKY